MGKPALVQTHVKLGSKIQEPLWQENMPLGTVSVTSTRCIFLTTTTTPTTRVSAVMKVGSVYKQHSCPIHRAKTGAIYIYDKSDRFCRTGRVKSHRHPQCCLFPRPHHKRLFEQGCENLKTVLCNPLKTSSSQRSVALIRRQKKVFLKNLIVRRTQTQSALVLTELVEN